VAPERRRRACDSRSFVDLQPRVKPGLQQVSGCSSLILMLKCWILNVINPCRVALYTFTLSKSL
jgi:hypothetical protein